MNDTPLNNTYCTAAFNHIYADMKGRYKLCCHSGYFENPTLEKMRSDDTLPFDYFLHEGMKEIRTKMLNGEVIPECHSCDRIDNKTPLSSPRYKNYQSLTKHYTEVRDVQLKLRIFGSACNLGCYMCFPSNSSTRRKELKDAEIDWGGMTLTSDLRSPIALKQVGKVYSPQGAAKKTRINKERFGDNALNWQESDGQFTIKPDQWENIKKHFLEYIHLVDNIKITGGEPFQLPRHFEFLKEIPDEHAKEITLSYDTNLSTTQFKNYYSLDEDVIPRFKNVHLAPSADHFGKKLSWIRYPIDVKEFENNLRKYKDRITGIHCTVSVLNIYDLKEIEDYYKENFGLPTTYNIVTHPKFLNIKNILDKDIWMPKAGNVLDALSDEANSEETQIMRTYISMLERHRKYSLKDAGYDDKYLKKIGYLHD